MIKRFAMLGVILLIALTVSAQEWPEEFSGNYIAYQEPFSIKMYMTEANDSSWVIPEEVGADFWYGSMVFDKCHGEQIVEVYFSKHAYRVCDGVRCFRGSAVHDVQLRYRLTWDKQTKAYILLGKLGRDDPPVRWNALVLTVGNHGHSMLTTGTVEVVEGKYVWEDLYPVYTYKIAPHITMRRSPGRRVDPTGNPVSVRKGQV